MASLPYCVRPCSFSNSRHPGVSSLYHLIESKEHIFLIQKYLKDTVLTLSRLSTAMSCASLVREAGDGAKDMRLRFVIYQLLQVVAYIHSQGLCIDLWRPHEVTLSDNVWVSLGMRCSDRMNLAAECMSLLGESRASNESSNVKNCDVDIVLDAPRVKLLLGASGLQGPDVVEAIRRPPSYYEPITLQWVTGKVSNLEYLLAINAAAGRSLMNPAHHPVLPWVTDFTSEVIPGAGLQKQRMLLRDLTKSKFRLSKGDRQLETTFEHSNPPHHIPEILSELTYYIYMARRTPMQILKRIVRGYFVADHYPHSMTRMFNWTPDECSPEFYTDITVFESIHKAHGLEDIELPKFAPTPHDFLIYHRSILESDEVSCQLHNWIDLTFGYQLIGDEAVQNLNVPLVHALSKQQEQGTAPDLEGHPGITVLFDKPHPRKNVSIMHSSGDRCCDNNMPSWYDRDTKAMLDMGETYGIVSTPYPNFPHDAIPEPKKSDPKFLSTENRNDKTLELLKFAKTGNLDNPQCYRADALKFSASYGTCLEPCYELPLPTSVQNGPEVENRVKGKVTWDYEFQTKLEEYYAQPLKESDELFVNEIKKLTSVQSMNDSVKMSTKATIQLLQAQDMFAMGCLIAEIFAGKPLLSREAASSKPSHYQVQDMIHKCVLQGDSPVPLNIKRMITLLTHPHPVHRASASDILKLCCTNLSENEVPESTCKVQNGVFQFETCSHQVFEPLSSCTRRNLLEDFCYYSFPTHFKSVYVFIGRLKVARDGLAKLHAVSDNLTELRVCRLNGLSLILPHVLEVIEDPTPFQQLANSMNMSINGGDEVQTLITELGRIINVLGDRLGPQNTATILVPHVAVLLSKLNSCKLLTHFIKSKHFWLVIISRAGSRCFLRHFLPVILTYLMCGTLQAVPRATSFFCRKSLSSSYSSSSSPMGSLPLWVSGGNINDDQSDDWLFYSAKVDLLDVQEEALKVIMMLSVPEALGSGICTRYVLPALLSLMGNPRISITGFGFELSNEDYNMPYRETINPDTKVVKRELLNKMSYFSVFSDKITILSEYHEKYMFIVRAILGLCQKAGETVIASVILPKIFHEMLPQVFTNILNVYIPDSGNVEYEVEADNFASGPFLSALLEIIALLRGLLNMLTSNSIRGFYFNISDSVISNGGTNTDTPEGLSLLTLLMILPLPFLAQDSDEIGGNENRDSSPDEDHARVMRLLEFRQRHSMFLELCRLVTVAASQVSSDVVHGTVLPAINKFFTKFVHTYCDLDVRSNLMALAFEIGRALYIPMVQLVGADSFSTAVPEVNPRLEVWLMHNSSFVDSQTRLSQLNALPDTIFPVTMSKQDFIPEVEPEKEKGNWLGLMPEWLAPSPQKKPKTERKSSITVGKAEEARLNQQMDDAMRDAIAQQEVQRELVQTPVKRKPINNVVDSDDDSIDVEVTCQRTWPSFSEGVQSASLCSHTGLLGPKDSTEQRNPHTKSIMHYHGDNSFYHALNSFNSHFDLPRPSDRVYFKQGHSTGSLSLVNSYGRLINRSQATSFHPNPSVSTPTSRSKSNDDNVMGSFKKALKATIQRTPSKTDSPSLFGQELEEDEESTHKTRQNYDSAWQLGGCGRWFTDTTDNDLDPVPPPPPKSKSTLHSPKVSSPLPNISKAFVSSTRKKPAASFSMAVPKVVTDVATEAGEVFALNMVNRTSWAFDSLAFKASAGCAISVLLTDPTERFLVAGTNDGEMKVWNLMSNPVVEVMKYSAHQAGVYAAGFLKSGTHVASCDGTIRIWDIQTGMTITDLQRSHSEMDVFSHLQVVSPRTGVGSDMSKHGDDQLMTCAGAVLAHYDIRVGYMCSLNPISEWKLYTNFSNGKIIILRVSVIS